MDCSSRNRSVMEKYSVGDGYDPFITDVRICVNEKGLELKQNSNIILKRPVKSTKRLTFGAKRADPSFFERKEKETPSKSLEEKPEQLSCLEKYDGSVNSPFTFSVEEKNVEEKATFDKNYTRIGEELWMNRHDYKHSAQSSMMTIQQDEERKNKETVTKSEVDWCRTKERLLTPHRNLNLTEETNEARNKFGAAKSISSDQFFGRADYGPQEKSDLSRFTDSTAISSDQLFNRAPKEPRTTELFRMDAAAIEDMSECLRHGVCKVARKLGSAMNSFVPRRSQEFDSV